MSSLRDLQREVHQVAKDKGWHDTKRTPLEIHALITTEVAEATEQVREGWPELYRLVPADPQPEQYMLTPDKEAFHKLAHLKPEGEAIELADAVIRVMDYFESKGWDLEYVIKLKTSYNTTRSHRHGGKLY